MPFINVKTNKVLTDADKDALKASFGKSIACLGKSESWLMVGFDDNMTMYFKGDSSSPLAFVDVSVFGSPSDSGCEKMTGEICSVMQSVLGISADKVYVKYSGTSQWGWNNMNF